ncbi:hypothetical protein TomTYG75_07660 [Sphingobium sp. TomTYG75]
MKWFKAGRHLARGDNARDNRNWRAAARSYERFLRRRPDNAAIWVQLGHMYKESGRYASAAKAYQKALNLAPEDADIHLQIGHLNKLTGNMRLALLAFRRALAIDPTLASARREVGHSGAEHASLGGGDELMVLKTQLREVTSRLILVEQAVEEIMKSSDRH